MSAFMPHTPQPHPWFAAHPKRKRFDYESQSEGFGPMSSADPSTSSPRLLKARKAFGLRYGSHGDNPEGESHERAVKRIRTGEVESGFASMSLKEVEMDDGQSFTASTNGENTKYLSSQTRMWSELPDETMKGMSWFEPEKDRIVVLDLSESDIESEQDALRHPDVSQSPMQNTQADSPSKHATQYEISQTYLSHLPDIARPKLSDFTGFQDPRFGALVLYRSPVYAIPSELPEDDGPELFASIEEVVEANVEPDEIDMAMEMD